MKLAWLSQYTVLRRDVELLRLLSNMVNQIISFTEFERAISSAVVVESDVHHPTYIHSLFLFYF